MFDNNESVMASSNSSRSTLDWTLCCLCQDHKKDTLRCPADVERFHSAYDTLEKDLQALEKLGALPNGFLVMDAKTL